MNPMVKKLINYGITICLAIVVALSIFFGIKALINWEAEVPDDFLVMKVAHNQGEQKKEDFPKKINFYYSMKDGIPIVGKDKLYTYGKIDGTDSDYGFYLIDKTEKQYKFLTGSKKDFAFTNTNFYHLTQPFSFEEQTGLVTIQFFSYNQYQEFLDDANYGENWREVIEYIREQKEEKSPEK